MRRLTRSISPQVESAIDRPMASTQRRAPGEHEHDDPPGERRCHAERDRVVERVQRHARQQRARPPAQQAKQKPSAEQHDARRRAGRRAGGTRPKMAPLSAAPRDQPEPVGEHAEHEAAEEQLLARAARARRRATPNAASTTSELRSDLSSVDELLLARACRRSPARAAEDPAADDHHRAAPADRAPERRAAQAEPVRAHAALVELDGEQRRDDEQRRPGRRERRASRPRAGCRPTRSPVGDRQQRERDRAAEEREPSMRGERRPHRHAWSADRGCAGGGGRSTPSGSSGRAGGAPGCW